MPEFSFDVSTAIDRLCSPLKTGLGILSADLGTCFKRYLTNAYENYNNVKTLVSRDTPRQIIGDDEIYVSVGVKYNDDEIDTLTVEPLLGISNNIIVEGTGGAGKTMLMKYLFLNTIKREAYIPVLVKLNEISRQRVKKISIYDLIYKTIGEFSDDVTKEAFKHSLDSSKKKYLFLFDGFDEIAGSHAERAAIAINDFCKRYPSNPCIVTSRPGMDYTQLKKFTKTEMLPLNKAQAVELASKICLDKEKAGSFCKQLDAELYEKHKEFAENPLLLSMMFLTFIDNGSVPDRIVDFYDKAYNALFSNHDRFKEGEFKRIFKSSLKPNEFKDVFSYFCFDTYMDEEYSFSENEIVERLKNYLSEYGLDKSEAENYLSDLVTAVCLILKDGTSYTFAHRSFQAYFAALYTEKLSDDEQRELFESLSHSLLASVSDKEDYYNCLIQLEGERFAVNAIEKVLRELDITKPFNTEKNLKQVYNRVSINLYCNKLFLYSGFGYKKYANELFLMIKQYNEPFNSFSIYGNKYERLYHICKKADRDFDPDNVLKRCIYFRSIDTSNNISKEEKAEFYRIILEESHIAKLFSDIYDWLEALDKKREAQKNATGNPYKKFSPSKRV